MKTHYDKPDKREMTLPYYKYEELLEDLHNLATIVEQKTSLAFHWKVSLKT